MGRIQTNIGLITGIPITDTVNSLMALAARPQNLLVGRTQVLQAEQVAVTELLAVLLKMKYITNSLGKQGLFDQRKAVSSDPDTLSVTLIGDPPKGSFQFAPLRMAQSQQLLSSGFSSDDDPIGGGKLTFRFGDDVERSALLELFDGGQGVTRGKIRITDRSGASAQIDLSTVQTVEDVLEAISGNTMINVMAIAWDDGIRLIDNTGQAVSNLKVQEVGWGTTAASLGLDEIDVDDDVADGRDMIRLYEQMDLDLLNDGSGVQTDHVLEDIEYELRDGTTGSIDLSPRTGAAVDEELTLGEILDVINAAEPGKLKVEIAPDGDRLVLTDLTEGGGSFQVQALNESEALSGLGLDGLAVGGVITGRRILGGAGTVLLSSLGGGKGFGQLGSLELTDRTGASATVDLSGSETLEEVIDAVNAASLGIVAQVNQARNGIQLVDTTEASAGNLIVANGDATDTADKLAIAVNDDVLSVNSGDLHLQVVAYNTKLSALNGGAGVARGRFTLIDTHYNQATLDLGTKDVETVGDVIREINRLGLDVLAELNAAGDGILIRDTGYGSGKLSVEEGNTSTAADLHLLGAAVEVDFEGTPTQVIDGTTTYTVIVDSPITAATRLDDLNGGSGVALAALTIVDSTGQTDTLDLSVGDPQTIGDLIQKINSLAVDVTAEINETKDGILLRDLGGGDGELQVIEGSSTTASDLNLLRSAVKVDYEGETAQVIDGADGRVRSLDELKQKINELDAGVTAMTFMDGSSRPFRLSVVSDRTGKAGRLVFDTSAVGFSMQEAMRAQDALLVFGPPSSAASNVLISSSSNTFRDVLSGVTLEAKQTATNPVTVTVSTDDTDLVANVQTMVDNYNQLREQLDTLTAYDPESDTRSVLTGDLVALRLDSELSYLLSGPFAAAGSIRSLAEVGVDLKKDGTLSFSSSKLRATYSADPAAVREFFTTAEFGVSARFDRLLERLGGEDTSLLAQRLNTLQDKIDRNQERIKFLQERLDAQRERLLLQFYRLELAVGRIQNNLTALDSIKPLTLYTDSRR
jgi:flagellar hook-associated protein 2